MRTLLVIVLALVAAACTNAPHRIPDIGTMLAVPSDGTPWRLQVHEGRIQAVTISIPAHTVPAFLVKQAQALVPDASPHFHGREWGPNGSGYRLEFRRQTPQGEDAHSMLLGRSGTMLEYRRSAPLPAVPAKVLSTALAIGPQVEAAQLCTNANSTQTWHCTILDTQGRRHTSLIDPTGRLIAVHKVVQAEIQWLNTLTEERSPGPEM